MPASDRAATLAYFEAGYAFDQAVVANLTASNAAAESFASRVGGECPGVFAGAPQIHTGSLGAGVHIGQVFREAEQLGKLKDEVQYGSLSAWYLPDREAVSALVSKVMKLQWSGPKLTRAIHEYVVRFAQEYGWQAPDPCADVKAWAASGYKTLPEATKQLSKELASRRAEAAESPRDLLAKDEEPEAKMVIQRTQTLVTPIETSLAALEQLDTRLENVLGVQAPSKASEKPAEGTPRGTKQPASPQVKYLPGGIRTLIKAKAPGGARFSIVGERYRFLGHVYFQLRLSVAGSDGSSETSSESEPDVLTTALSTGCQPHPYAIFYGILKDPADTVRARVSGAVRGLRRAALPASLHEKGMLVYLASSTVPSEVLVRSPRGKPIFVEKYGPYTMANLQACSEEEEEEGEVRRAIGG